MDFPGIYSSSLPPSVEAKAEQVRNQGTAQATSLLRGSGGVRLASARERLDRSPIRCEV